MPKKISALNVVYQLLLKKDTSTLKFSLNWAGEKDVFRNINASPAGTFGIMLISSVCLLDQ